MVVVLGAGCGSDGDSDRLGAASEETATDADPDDTASDDGDDDTSEVTSTTTDASSTTSEASATTSAPTTQEPSTTSIEPSTTSTDSTTTSAEPAPSSTDTTVPDTTETTTTETTTTEAPNPTQPTTTRAPTTRPPTTTVPFPIPDRPVRIYFAGDSMVEGVRPPIEAAFSGSEVVIDKGLVPGFVNEAVSGAPVWPGVLQDGPPDVVVMLFGVWENAALRSGEHIDTTEPGWQTEYRRELVEPVVDTITAQGTHIIWLSMTTVRSEEISEQFAELNSIWRQVAATNPSVHWINSQRLLNAPNGDFRETHPNPDAPYRRIINPDGLHLCAGAGYRLAPPIRAKIVDLTGLKVNSDWEDTNWSTDRFGYIPGECTQSVD